MIEKDLEDGTLRCLLCDFGIASPTNPEFYGVKMFKRSDVIGSSAPYSAPEIFLKLNDNSGQVTEYDHPEIVKSGDVYAMGVVMYEVLTRRIPWTELKVDYARIEKAALTGQRPQFPDDLMKRWGNNGSAQAYLDVIKKCWSQKPLERPSAQQVAAITEKLISSSKRR